MRVDYEKRISGLRSKPDNEEKFTKVLEKSIYEKARDKMKMGKKKDEEDTEKE